MIRSFLNVFLPEDEHKRTRILYFMAEATFLTVVILLLFGLMKYVLNIVHLDTDFVVMIGPFLVMAYVYFRYIFSGIEFTDVANKGEFKKQRRVVFKRSLLVGVLFFMISPIVKGIPNSPGERIELIALSIIFTIFYVLFDYISLKRSYKINRDLTDD